MKQKRERDRECDPKRRESKRVRQEKGEPSRYRKTDGDRNKEDERLRQ